MGKYSRFTECKDALFSDWAAGWPAQREHLKRWGASKIVGQRDVLAERATCYAKQYALGGLRSVCWKAGKSNAWIDQHLFTMLDRNAALHDYDLSRRIALGAGA